MTPHEALEDGGADEPEEAPEPPELQRERRFRYLITHLSQGRDWRRLFELVEQRGFLAAQAEHWNGFRQTGADVEAHVLPAAVATGDWDRFVRFAALAANLRALAEDLADPGVLRALARGGRRALAQDLADRQPDPLRRAEARAVTAVALGRGSAEYGTLLRAVAEDLQEAQPAGEEDDRSRLASLAAVARLLGPELDALWPEQIARLAPSPADAAEVWQALAMAWLERGDVHSEGLWRALAVVSDPRRLLAFAPERLADLEPEDPWQVLVRLGPLFGPEARLRGLAFATFLGRLARRYPDRAVAAWERWVESEAVDGSPELVEAGGELFARLDPARLETLCAGLSDAAARAALRVLDLKARPDSRRAAAALAAVERVLDEPARLHWSLRYLAARTATPEPPRAEVLGQLGAVAAYLYERRYDAPEGDLRRFLDLLADLQPGALQAHLEGVVWSPSSRPATLLKLAGETGRTEVAGLLLAHAERYAAAASATEAEGFQTRKELLVRAACRLCGLRGELGALDEAVERLLPEEEDDLRAVLARELVLWPAAGPPDRPQLARTVAGKIHDRRRRLLTLLEILPPEKVEDELLAAPSLYAAMARVDRSLDEVAGLAELLCPPLDPPDPEHGRAGAIRDLRIRAQMLLRLASHSLAFQRARHANRVDRGAAIELVRFGLAVDTDAQLAALTPEVAELGAQAGGSRAVAELEEAVRRLLCFGGVPWPHRLEALERLLSCLAAILLAPGNRRGPQRAGRVLAVLGRLPGLPSGLEGGAIAAEELRRRWHEVLPLAAAALDRLPEGAAAPVRRAFQAGLSFPLAAVQERILPLCLLPGPERERAAAVRLAGPPLDPAEAAALAYLLAGRRLDLLTEALGRLPEGAARDELALRLVRHGWIEPAAARDLLGRLPDEAARRRVRVWLPPAPTPEEHEEWCRDLAGLAARGEVDPSAPADEPLVRRLWEHATPASLPLLAQAVLEALRDGGRLRAEAALRLWLHAWLAPRLGHVREDGQLRADRAVKALGQALELAPAGAQSG